ncbi:MAG: TonB-dependent receptor [Verrucomicrobia bacterium]|nr:TonB-dependent receptor [Verrucomicrobiota bacterium]
MNRKNSVVLLGAWMAFALAPTTPTHAAASNPIALPEQQAGSVAGQVSNAATGSFLEGAVVALAGTNRVAITDREGRYEFSGVPGNQVRLFVSFSGLDPQIIPVPMAAGRKVVRDVGLTAEIYKLDKFTVAGEREGTAKAETLQRQAPNVKAIVSADTFGNVADGNVGNLLQNVVGITADYNGNDVRQVSIRGVGSELNSVTMDGQQVATSQSAGAGRAFEFEQASLGNVETIEVTKAPTPDMDGASIGGSVNLVSKTAFDRAAGRVLAYTLGISTTPENHTYPTGRWKQPIAGIGPSMNFMYTDIIGVRKNIGITLTGTLHSHPGGSEIIANSFERKSDPGPVYNFSTTRTLGGGTRSRIATGFRLDYRWSDQTTIALNTSYNFFHENNDSRAQALATTQTIATVDASGNRTGGGFINPNYSDTFTRVHAGASSTSVITNTTNDKSGRTYLFSPMVRHRFDGGLNINYSLSYSNSATYYDVSHHDDKYDSRPKGTVTYRLANVGWSVDRTKDRFFPLVTQTEGPDMTNMNNYGTLLLTQTDRRGFDTVISGRFDLKKELSLARPTYLKTGFTYQQQSRKYWQDPRRYNYTGPDGVLNTADDNVGLGQFADIPHTPHADENKVFKDGLAPWANAFGVARHQKLYPEFWKEDIAFTSGKLTSLRLIDEKIAAAYMMGNVRLGPLSVLSGVRVEDTRDAGEGPLSQITPAEAARRAAWVGPVTDAEQRRRNLAQFGRRYTNRGQYRFFLPGVHLKYEPLAGLVTRLSWSTGVGRPDFGSIIPNTTVNDTAQTVAVTNPDLKPQYSNNWDLTLEYYFKSQGMVSVGAFTKKIKDYIATDSSQFVPAGADNGFDGEFVGYRISTTTNNGDAKIEGLEFSYQQQLTFLPGWSKGFGIYANFTRLRTAGNNSEFAAGPGGSGTTALAGFLDTTGNIGLGYRGFGLDLRMQAVFRGKFLVAQSTNAALVQWQEPKWTWSWKSRYNFSKRIGVFLDVENVFAEPLNRIYAAYPNRVISYRTFVTKIVTGIQGRF